MTLVVSTPTIITLPTRNPTLPTSSDPIVAFRVSASQIAVRALGAGGLIDEFGWFDPQGYAGCAAGWWPLYQAVWDGGQRIETFRQPSDPTQRTVLPYAVRLGTTGTTYPTGYTVTGGGHGERCDLSSVSIKMDGAGPNLQDLANWPVGKVVRGSSSFGIESTPRLLRGSTEVASIPSFLQAYIVGTGLVEIGSIRPLSGFTNVAMQDSPIGMHAVSNPAFDQAKVANFAGRTVTLVGETNPALQQKGNWRKSELTSAHDTMQFFRSTDSLTNALISEARMAKGPSVQNAASSLTAWQLCQFGGIHVLDTPLFKKFTPFAVSAAETGPPGEYALNGGIDFYTIRRARRGAVL